jgi:hypothetical protein
MSEEEEKKKSKFVTFTGHQTKIRQFLQACLGYLDINQNIYDTNQLKIGSILSYMNDSEAANWKEYYLDTLEDSTTEMPKFLNLVTFLADIRKAFRATDQVQDMVNRLKTLKQGKKTAEELNTEFLQLLDRQE